MREWIRYFTIVQHYFRPLISNSLSQSRLLRATKVVTKIMPLFIKFFWLLLVYKYKKI
jgi:hypothetical protein